jgi:hypothetical protein
MIPYRRATAFCPPCAHPPACRRRCGRRYFGEKIALYFVWLGYYTTMLWIPALIGIILTITQVISQLS